MKTIKQIAEMAGIQPQMVRGRIRNYQESTGIELPREYDADKIRVFTDEVAGMLASYKGKKRGPKKTIKTLGDCISCKNPVYESQNYALDQEKGYEHLDCLVSRIRRRGSC